MGKRGSCDSKGAASPETRKRTKTSSVTSPRKRAAASLEHCQLCLRNSQDVEFSEKLALLGACSQQCKDCYALHMPLRLIHDWPQFVDLCKTDEKINDMVEAARVLPSTLPKGYAAFFAEGCAKTTSVGIRLARRGKFFTKGEIKQELQQTPKQARLRDAVSFLSPSGDQLEGYLLRDPAQPGMQVEVYSDSKVQMHKIFLDAGGPQLFEGAAVQAAEKALADSDIASSSVAVLLAGTAPSMAELRAKAGFPGAGKSKDRLEKDKDEEEADDEDEKGKGEKSDEDSDGSDNSKGSKSSKTSKTGKARGSVSGITTVSSGTTAAVFGGALAGLCQPAAAIHVIFQQEGIGKLEFPDTVYVSPSLRSPQDKGCLSDDDKTPSKMTTRAKTTQFWIARLPLERAMQDPEVDKRIIAHSRQAAARESKPGKDTVGSERLLCHIRSYAQVSFLAESQVGAATDADFHQALSIASRCKASLPVTTLVGVLHRQVRLQANIVIASSSLEATQLVFDMMRPFRFEDPEGQTFKVHMPTLGPLTLLLSPRRVCTLVHQWIIRDMFVELLRRVGQAAAWTELVQICDIGLKSFELPDAADPDEAIVRLLYEAETSFRATMLICSPRLTTSKASVEGIADVMTLHTASQQTKDSTLMTEVAILLRQQDDLTNNFDNLVHREAVWRMHGEAIQQVMVGLQDIGSTDMSVGTRNTTISQAMVQYEKYNISFPQGSLSELQDYIKQALHKHVELTLAVDEGGKTIASLAMLQQQLEVGSRCLPFDASLDSLIEKVAASLRSEGKNDKLKEVLAVAGQLDSIDDTGLQAALRVGFVANLSLDESQNASIVAAMDKLRTAATSSLVSPEGYKEGLPTFKNVVQLMGIWCKYLNAGAQVQTRAFVSLVDMARDALGAILEFTNSGEDLADRIAKDTDGFRATRLSRCCQALHDAIALHHLHAIQCPEAKEVLEVSTELLASIAAQTVRATRDQSKLLLGVLDKLTNFGSEAAPATWDAGFKGTSWASLAEFAAGTILTRDKDLLDTTLAEVEAAVEADTKCQATLGQVADGEWVAASDLIKKGRKLQIEFEMITLCHQEKDMPKLRKKVFSLCTSMVGVGLASKDFNTVLASRVAAALKLRAMA
jgi:hypothetical protein